MTFSPFSDSELLLALVASLLCLALSGALSDSELLEDPDEDPEPVPDPVPNWVKVFPRLSGLPRLEGRFPEFFFLRDFS